jgi:tRNA A37 threonylcarbamoyladenosine dehydratase
MLSKEYRQRFSGLARVYGEAALAPLQRAHFCVVGIGGVGSWAAEACARSGIGNITLIDHDDIDISNTNRQLHTTVDSLQRSKVEVLRERILAINPECNCSAIDDLVTRGNIEKFELAQYDYVIDAIDHVSHKLTLMHHCRRNKIRCISTGGAGGLTDPTQIVVKDLTLSFNDPLLAKVRSTLRQQLGYSRNPFRPNSRYTPWVTARSVMKNPKWTNARPWIALPASVPSSASPPALVSRPPRTRSGSTSVPAPNRVVSGQSSIAPRFRPCSRAHSLAIS